MANRTALFLTLLALPLSGTPLRGADTKGGGAVADLADSSFPAEVRVDGQSNPDYASNIPCVSVSDADGNLYIAGRYLVPMTCPHGAARMSWWSQILRLNRDGTSSWNPRWPNSDPTYWHPHPGDPDPIKAAEVFLNAAANDSVTDMAVAGNTLVVAGQCWNATGSLRKPYLELRDRRSGERIGSVWTSTTYAGVADPLYCRVAVDTLNNYAYLAISYQTSTLQQTVIKRFRITSTGIVEDRDTAGTEIKISTSQATVYDPKIAFLNVTSAGPRVVLALGPTLRFHSGTLQLLSTRALSSTDITVVTNLTAEPSGSAYVYVGGGKSINGSVRARLMRISVTDGSSVTKVFNDTSSGIVRGVDFDAANNVYTLERTVVRRLPRLFSSSSAETWSQILPNDPTSYTPYQQLLFKALSVGSGGSIREAGFGYRKKNIDNTFDFGFRSVRLTPVRLEPALPAGQWAVKDNDSVRFSGTVGCDGLSPFWASVIEYRDENGTVPECTRYVTGNTSINGTTINSTAIGLGVLSTATRSIRLEIAVTPGDGWAWAGRSSVILVDRTPPSITQITSNTPDGAYTTNGQIQLTMKFSEEVRLSGAIDLHLNSGGATLTGLNGVRTGSLDFLHNIGRGEWSPDLSVRSVALESMSTLIDGAGHPVALTIADSANLAATRSIVIEARTLGSTWQRISGPAAGNGWRLMGVVNGSGASLPTSALVNSVTGLPDQILTPYYTGTYQTVTSLTPGVGYWVKTKPGAVYQAQGTAPTASEWTFTKPAGIHYLANPYAGPVQVDSLKFDGLSDLQVYRQLADGTYGWIGLGYVGTLNKFEGFVAKFDAPGFLTIPNSNE